MSAEKSGLKKRYVSVNELALVCGVTPRTVRNWWNTGKTCLQAWHPDHRLGVKGLRFTKESADQFCNGNMINPGDGDQAEA